MSPGTGTRTSRDWRRPHRAHSTERLDLDALPHPAVLERSVDGEESPLERGGAQRQLENAEPVVVANDARRERVLERVEIDAARPDDELLDAVGIAVPLRILRLESFVVVV